MSPADFAIGILSAGAAVAMIFAAYWAGQVRRMDKIEDRYEQELAKAREGGAAPR